MNSRQPPGLALTLLRRFVPDEALAGDLVEDFDAGRSSFWFWRQVVFAMAASRTRRVADIRPLGLIPAEAAIGRLHPPSSAGRGRLPVNLAVGPRGLAVGGLGLVAVGVLVAIVLPTAWYFLAAVLLAALCAGGLLGMVLILVSSRQRPPHRDRAPEGVLFR